MHIFRCSYIIYFNSTQSVNNTSLIQILTSILSHAEHGIYLLCVFTQQSSRVLKKTLLIQFPIRHALKATQKTAFLIANETTVLPC